jgi:hypothetical protein
MRYLVDNTSPPSSPISFSSRYFNSSSVLTLKPFWYVQIKSRLEISRSRRVGLNRKALTITSEMSCLFCIVCPMCTSVKLTLTFNASTSAIIPSSSKLFFKVQMQQTQVELQSIREGNHIIVSDSVFVHDQFFQR